MKKLKKLVAVVLSVICCFSMSTVAFAVEPTSNEEISVTSDETVQPRIGIAGYENHYHSGGATSVFYIKTNSITLPSKQFTVQTSNFNDSTIITLFIYNSENQLVATFKGEGSAKWPNRPMNGATFVNGDTYTVICGVSDTSDDGWVGVWIY